MFKNRILFDSDITLTNEYVGFGTDTPLDRLHVVGTVKGIDFKIDGESTFTSYGGFIYEKQLIDADFNLEYIDTHTTLSSDVVTEEDKVFEVADGAILEISTLDNLNVDNHLGFPNGGTASRNQHPVEGMVRFNDDLNTLEFYNGIEWRQFTVSGASGRGVFGSTFNIPAIDYINISSLGNAINFGVTTLAAQGKSGCSSFTRGLWGGGYAPGVLTNIIDYVTIQSEGNAIDFGDLTISVSNRSSCSSSTRGIWAGGANPTNVIEYVQIATIGNALDFGDLTLDRQTPAALSSPTRGVFAGGTKNPLPRDIIDYITIASTGNAVNFGTLTTTRSQCAYFSSSTRGILGGGLQDALPTIVNTIDYITIASVGNAQDFGDLTVSRRWSGGTSTQTRGIIAGGLTPTIANTMDYITIASIGNAIDFGDLTVPKWSCDGVSDSHGGLGGF